MATTFDPATQAALQRYHQEKRSRTKRALTTGLQGAAMAMQGRGAQGRELVDTRRGFIEGGIDGDTRWMNPEERLDKRQELEGTLFEQETYFYDKAFEEAMEEYRQDEQNYRTLIGAAETSRATSQRGASMRAQLQSRVHVQNMGKLMNDMEGFYKLDKSTEFEVSSSIDEGMVAYVSPQSVEAFRDKVEADTGTRPSAKAAQQGLAGKLAKNGNFENFVETVVNNPDVDPGQKMAALRYVSETYGVNPADIVEPGQLNTLQSEAYAALDEKKMQLEIETGEALRTGGATFGGVAPEIRQQLAENAEKAKARRAIPMEERARKHAQAAMTKRGLGEEDIKAVEYDEPDRPEGFEPGAGEEFLGLPIKPASTPQERTLQMLDVVEEFPEHPPARQAKMDLMGSDGFQQYKKSRGYEGLNDDDVLKEMHREYKHQMRSNKREFRARRRQNIDSGVAPPKLGSRLSGPPKKPEAPVQGSDK